MTITYRQTKGSALLYGEIDENFRDLLEDTTLHRVLTNGNTSNLDMTVNSAFCNTVSTNSVTTGTLTITSNSVTLNTVSSNTLSINSLTITTASTPANSTANGTQGQITWDADYIYVCVANNIWKRTAITTWV